MSPRQPVAVRGVGKPHIVPDRTNGGFVCYKPNGRRLVMGYAHGDTPAEAYRMWRLINRSLATVWTW